MKHFITLADFSAQEIIKILDLSVRVKKEPVKYQEALKGDCIGLIFEKPSLRTKTAFYAGAFQLGAGALYYAPDEIKLGVRETIADVGRNLSRFLDAIVLRTFAHEKVVELARFSTVPVINGLSDLVHPSQILADIMTIEEIKGDIRKMKAAYIGDGDNVCHSLLEAFSILGGNWHVATPKKYQPQNDIVEAAKKRCAGSGAVICLTDSPSDAARDADVIYTDVWISMGKEKEKKHRLKTFKNFQVNSKLLSLAKKEAIVMHCLPAHRGEEITDEVIDGKQSVVFEQAENRLHTAKAILLYTSGKD